MKNYLNFSLTGKKLFPIWLVFLILFIAPYMALILQMKDLQQGQFSLPLFFSILILLIIVAFAITFYIAKLSIENVSYKDNLLIFKGTLGTYFGKILLGLLLSIITIGIYGAWFIKDIMSFFVNNSSYNSNSFAFKGKGSNLFVIILLTVILPIIIMSIVLTPFMMMQPDNLSSLLIIQQVVMMIIMIPYMYFVYRWMVNVDYKGYNILWKTDFWGSCGKIALEILLSIITIGIYSPLAILRLYKYFVDRTHAVATDSEMNFGFDIDPLNDFLFLWGQILLSIVTLGIYYPWAYCKIGNRIMGKTYIEKK
jgi:uncharacterized membrane protein YjgN (DUF898 family)